MGKDSLLLWEGGRGPIFRFQDDPFRIWVILSHLVWWEGGDELGKNHLSQTKNVVASGAAPLRSRFGKVMWFDISAPRSWKWWGDGIFSLKKCIWLMWKKGFNLTFWEVGRFGALLGSSVGWTKMLRKKSWNPCWVELLGNWFRSCGEGGKGGNWSLGISLFFSR